MQSGLQLQCPALNASLAGPQVRHHDCGLAQFHTPATTPADFLSHPPETEDSAHHQHPTLFI